MNDKLSKLLDDKCEEISYKQWKGGRLELVNDVSVQEVIEELSVQLLKYKKHILIMKTQAKNYVNRKKSYPKGL